MKRKGATNVNAKAAAAFQVAFTPAPLTAQDHFSKMLHFQSRPMRQVATADPLVLDEPRPALTLGNSMPLIISLGSPANGAYVRTQAIALS